MLGNILGRLSVGWVGLTYAVDDTDVSVVDALVGTWWPNVGESLRKQDVLDSPSLGTTALQDVMRIVATAVPFPHTVEIEANDKGDGDIKDWSFLDVPNLTRVNDAREGSVKYIYYFQDEGGDPAIRGNRTLQISGQCELTTIGKFLDTYGMKSPPSPTLNMHRQSLQFPVTLLIMRVDFQSTTFYPTEERDSTAGTGIFGWILYSHPKDESTCGPSCIYFGTPPDPSNTKPPSLIRVD